MEVDVDVLERLMRLMGEHDVDEVSFAGVTVKKSRHKAPAVTQASDAESAMARHLQPLPNEPWSTVPQEVVDQWAEKGGG